jgi:hypothetical protein
MAAIVRPSFARLKSELDRLKHETAALAPLLVIVENSPDGQGSNEGRVGGVVYWREAGEGETDFHARLVRLAWGAGEALAIIGRGPSRRAELAALKADDDGSTIEIGGPQP